MKNKSTTISKYLLQLLDKRGAVFKRSQGFPPGICLMVSLESLGQETK